jgi:ankyrin repeat protein
MIAAENGASKETIELLLKCGASINDTDKVTHLRSNIEVLCDACLCKTTVETLFCSLVTCWTLFPTPLISHHSHPLVPWDENKCIFATRSLLSQDGMSVLMIALNSDLPEVVKFLLDHKADVTAVSAVPYSCLCFRLQ